jgi:HSP20 family protein
MSIAMAQLIQSLLESSGAASQRARWAPPVDIYRTSDGWLLKFDLAGVRPSDFELETSGRRLTVRGVRRDWIVEELGPCSAYSMEITYSHFERTLELPCELQAMKIDTQYRDGMLLVRLRTAGCPG